MKVINVDVNIVELKVILHSAGIGFDWVTEEIDIELPDDPPVTIGTEEMEPDSAVEDVVSIATSDDDKYGLAEVGEDVELESPGIPQEETLASADDVTGPGIDVELR